jgi:hypothetical protein
MGGPKAGGQAWPKVFAPSSRSRPAIPPSVFLLPQSLDFRTVSTIISAVVPSSFVTSEREIEECALRLGVKVHFPEGLNLLLDSGAVPCTINGQPASIELTHDGVDAAGAVTLHFAARASYASFAACAYVASAVSILGGGMVQDDDGQELGGQALVNWLKSVDPPEPETESNELRIEVSVVGPRGNGFLQLKLGRVPSGVHLARRLVESIQIEKVPPKLRAPNSRFVLWCEMPAR